MKSLLKGHHRRSSSVDQDFAAEKRVPLKINTTLTEAPNSSPLHQTPTFSSTSPPGTTPVTPTFVHPSTFFGSPSAGAKRAFKPIKALLRNKNSNSSLGGTLPEKKSLSPTREFSRPIVKASISTPSIYGTKTHTWGEDPLHSSESRPALESLTSISSAHSMSNRDEFSFVNDSRNSINCEVAKGGEKPKSERMAVEQDDDSSSVFSFEQNAKSGRNASIRYYKDKNELLNEEDRIPVNPGKFRRGAKQTGFIDDFLASTGEFDEQDFGEEMNYYDEDEEDDETDNLFNRQLFSSDEEVDFTEEDFAEEDVAEEEAEEEAGNSGLESGGPRSQGIETVKLSDTEIRESSSPLPPSQPANTGSQIHNLLLTASYSNDKPGLGVSNNHRYSWFPKDEEKVESVQDPRKKSPMSQSSRTNKSATSDDSDIVSCNYSLPAGTSKYQNFFNESEELDTDGLDDSLLDEINQVPADFEFGELDPSSLKKSNSTINKMDSQNGFGITRKDSGNKFQRKHKTVTLFTPSQQRDAQEDDFDFASLKLSTRFQKISKQPNSPLTTISETSFDSPRKLP